MEIKNIKLLVFGTPSRSVRVGTAAGAKGAVYLLKGTTADPRYTSAFLESIGAPPNSCVVITPNAYVTNEAWDEIIFAMPLSR